MEGLVRNLRYALRQLRLNPGFTAVAVLSLALGIGANTAIFQLVDAVRLRTLPVAHPEQLALVDFTKDSMRNGNFSTRSARLTYSQWQQIESQQQGFSGLAAWSANEFNLALGGEVRFAEGLFVNGDFFRVLGVEPILGRVYAAQDDRMGCGSPAAVISYGFWQREFAGDRNVLGRDVTLNAKPFPIMGVTAPAFFGVEPGFRYDVALPLCADDLFRTQGNGRISRRDAWWLSMMGRLKPGWTVEGASAQLQAVSPGIMQATLPERYRPDDAKRYLKNKLASTAGGIGVSELRRQYETPLSLLLATTGLVLLIACANLANLLLARASARERELAVRQAIGASRGALVGQLMTESLLLAIAGAALGTLLAQAVSRALVALLGTAHDPVFLGIGVDWRVLGFTAVVGVATCLLFGLLPAMRATRIAPAAAVRVGGRGLTMGRERFSLRRALVVAQVSLSLVLLVGALLFTRSLDKLLHADLGFRPEGILSVRLDLSTSNYPKERILAVYRDLYDKLRPLPGVVSAAQVRFTPVSGSASDRDVWAEGSNGPHLDTELDLTGPGYFQTMGTGFLAGRDFDDHDAIDSPTVSIVNEEFAKEVFGGGNPVGRAFRIEGDAGKPDVLYQVVGLVRNTKYFEIREDFKPIFFLPLAQDDSPRPGATFVLRVAGAEGEISRVVKRAVADVNPQIGIDFRMLRQQLDDSLQRDRLMAMLAGGFGLLAAILAIVGLYGVIAYTVERRRNEIGIRMALGADRRSVVALVLREAVLLVGAGLIIGTGLALWSGRAASSLLFGLKPSDPITLATAAILLTLVALAASYGPAWRAAHLDPMDALREE
jgi:putative ABC transport system permease protein